MSFISIAFVIFVCFFVPLYFAAGFLKKNAVFFQNVLFLAASLVFYAWADIRFLPFLLYVILVSYAAGFFCKTKITLALFVTAAAFPLLFFKYSPVHWIFPLGLSFFTFQSIGYIADVYTKKIPPERNIIRLALFISSFCTISCGPIQRAGKFIPQLNVVHRFSYDDATDGLKLFAWGLFKKLFIADRIAVYVNFVYANLQNQYGCALLLATVLYSFQIYCDFSGYSDMALGSLRFLGFDGGKNFNHPYLAQSVGDFWHKWHISLSSWLRDYIYIPLGGSRCSSLRIYFNLMVTFLLSGIWHGSSLNFLFWGALHGVYLCAERAIFPSDSKSSIKPTKIPAFLKIFVTFCLVSFAWIFFRCENMGSAFAVIKKIAHIPHDFVEFGAMQNSLGAKEAVKLLFGLTDPNFGWLKGMAKLFFVLLIFFCVEIMTLKKQGLEIIRKIHFVPRWILYAVLCTLILMSLPIDTNTEFLYFSF